MSQESHDAAATGIELPADVLADLQGLVSAMKDSGAIGEWVAHADEVERQQAERVAAALKRSKQASKPDRAGQSPSQETRSQKARAQETRSQKALSQETRSQKVRPQQAPSQRVKPQRERDTQPDELTPQPKQLQSKARGDQPAQLRGDQPGGTRRVGKRPGGLRAPESGHAPDTRRVAQRTPIRNEGSQDARSGTRQGPRPDEETAQSRSGASRSLADRVEQIAKKAAAAEAGSEAIVEQRSVAGAFQAQIAAEADVVAEVSPEVDVPVEPETGAFGRRSTADTSSRASEPTEAVDPTTYREPAPSTLAASTPAASTLATSTLAASTPAASTLATSKLAASTPAASTLATSTLAASTPSASTLGTSKLAASTPSASILGTPNPARSTGAATHADQAVVEPERQAQDPMEVWRRWLGVQADAEPSSTDQAWATWIGSDRVLPRQRDLSHRSVSGSQAPPRRRPADESRKASGTSAVGDRGRSPAVAVISSRQPRAASTIDLRTNAGQSPARINVAPQRPADSLVPRLLFDDPEPAPRTLATWLHYNWPFVLAGLFIVLGVVLIVRVITTT